MKPGNQKQWGQWDVVNEGVHCFSPRITWCVSAVMACQEPGKLRGWMACHSWQSGSSFAPRCTFRLVPVAPFPSVQLATLYYSEMAEKISGTNTEDGIFCLWARHAGKKHRSCMMG